MAPNKASSPRWAHQQKEFDEHRDRRSRAYIWPMRSGKSRGVIDVACYRFGKGDVEGVIVIAPNGVHLNYARNEAITRGFNVVVCKGIATAVGSGCTSGNWDGGWKVFVDCNGDQTISASTCPGNSDEAVLRVHPALSSEWTLRGDSHVPNYITFKAIGLPNTNGTLVFCQGGVLHSGNQPRSAAVTVNRTGRARVLSYNAYGEPLDNQGSALTSCHT